jgi:TM2 domain-containing membrane protein YozV
VSVRCPSCDARNADGAGWCTQCYARLDGPVPVASRPPAVPSERPADVASPGGDVPPVPVADRPVRDHDGRVEWRCARCERWSPLEAPSCVTCGGPREGFGEPAATEARELDVDLTMLTIASALVPGAGHLLAGRVGTGVARALLWVLWLGSGVATWWAGASGVAALPTVVSLGGAAVLWAATLVDVRRLADGDPREVLDTRRLLWLVGAVTVAVVVALVVAAVSVR